MPHIVFEGLMWRLRRSALVFVSGEEGKIIGWLVGWLID